MESRALAGRGFEQDAATSAFDNLALVYHSDIKHNSGKPYEGTPGHFDQRACVEG